MCYTKALVLEREVNSLSRVDEEAILTSLTTTSLSDQVVVYSYTCGGTKLIVNLLLLCTLPSFLGPFPNKITKKNLEDGQDLSFSFTV